AGQARRPAQALSRRRAQDRRLLPRSRAVGRGARAAEEGRQEAGGGEAQGADGEDADVAAQGRGAKSDGAARGPVTRNFALAAILSSLSGCAAPVPNLAREVYVAPVDVLQVRWRHKLTPENAI